MPRPRTPTNVLKLRGTFKANPKRTRVDPDPSGPLGEPPAHLTESELGCWLELTAMAPANVLTAGDRWIVEIASRLMCEFREVGRDFLASKLLRLQSALAAIGLSPADRSRVSAASSTERESDPWDMM